MIIPTQIEQMRLEAGQIYYGLSRALDNAGWLTPSFAEIVCNLPHSFGIEEPMVKTRSEKCLTLGIDFSDLESGLQILVNAGLISKWRERTINRKLIGPEGFNKFLASAQVPIGVNPIETLELTDPDYKIIHFGFYTGNWNDSVEQQTQTAVTVLNAFYGYIKRIPIEKKESL